MNIIHVPRRFTATHWGGTETVILQTCREQVRLGHTVRIETSLALATAREEAINGVLVRRHDYSYPWLGLGAESIQRLDQKGGNLFSFSLMRALQQEPKLDLIHLHTAKRLGGIVRHVARRRRIPYVISVHGGLLDVPAAEAATFAEPTAGKVEWGKLLGWWVGSRRVFDDAAAILCLGDEELARVQSRYPRVRALKFPNGVDAGRFAKGDGEGFRARHQIPPGIPLLLVMGRLDGQKNQRLAIQAMEELRRLGTRAHLLLIGHVTDDAYAAGLRALVDDLGLAEAVTIIPGVSADSGDLQGAYHAADVFVLPSIHEPFGIVILEAWAAGRAVVASRVGGIPSFVEDGRDGLLFESGDLAGLTQRLQQLIGNRELRRSLGEAGRCKAVGRYSWSSITGRLMELYEEVLRANPLRQ